VARVRRIDGDKRHRPQILALAEGDGLRRFRLGQYVFGKLVGNAMLMDRDQRDRARRPWIAQPRHDPGPRQAMRAWLADLLGLDQLALARPGPVAGCYLPVAVGALVDRLDPPTGLAVPIDAEHPLRPHADAPD